MVDLNGTPQFLKKVDYVTITPKTLTSVETQSVSINIKPVSDDVNLCCCYARSHLHHCQKLLS